MGYISTLFLTIATGFCTGTQANGTHYRDFIHTAMATYPDGQTIEEHWSVQVQRGQSQAKLAGICKDTSF